MKSIDSYYQHVPVLFMFNPFKHHLRYILSKINTLQNDKNNIDSELRKLIKILGHSQMDLYLGDLHITAICDFARRSLEEAGVFDQSGYCKWLEFGGKEYRILSFPDGSDWTFRLGKTRERFIHIHPGRYSKNTIRVRAKTFATVIVYFSIYGFDKLKDEKKEINKIRKNYLEESPVKSISLNFGIGKLMQIFREIKAQK